MPHQPFLFQRIPYGAALTLSWPLARLYYALRGATDGKYRRNHRARLGLDLPPRLPRERPRIWLHALSVGETASSVSLVRALRESAPQAEIVFSNATETGGKTAETQLRGLVDQFFFLPHDYPFAARAVVRRVAPSAFVLIETDVWPNLLCELEAMNVPSFLANARLSPRSHRRLLQVARPIRGIYGLFDRIFVQSEQDRLRYASLGLAAARIAALGNIKFDAALPSGGGVSPADVRAAVGISLERRVWIAGSTHEGEEEALLAVHRAIGRTFDSPLLVLAPRDIRRADAVEALCRATGFDPSRRSRGERAEGTAVHILDTLGELKAFYGVADAAFIGGSLVPFGGHNPLEATALGVPTCWGPHLFNFREIETGLTEGGAGRRVDSAGDLEAVLTEWLGNADLRKRAGAACRKFIGENTGASGAIARIVVDAALGR